MGPRLTTLTPAAHSLSRHRQRSSRTGLEAPDGWRGWAFQSRGQ